MHAAHRTVEPQRSPRCMPRTECGGDGYRPASARWFKLVVAEVGQPLRWISEGDRFAFWKSEKSEVKCRLVAPDATGFCLDDYPNRYCYVAAVWQCGRSTTVIVLEKHH